MRDRWSKKIFKEKWDKSNDADKNHKFINQFENSH